MKYFVIIMCLSLASSLTLTAQDDTKNNLKNNFELSVAKTELQFKNKDKGRGTGYKQFKRWEEFVQKRLDVNGNRVNNTSISFRAFNQMKTSGRSRGDRSNRSEEHTSELQSH